MRVGISVSIGIHGGVSLRRRGGRFAPAPATPAGAGAGAGAGSLATVTVGRLW